MRRLRGPRPCSRAWPECRFAVGVHPHHAKVVRRQSAGRRRHGGGAARRAAGRPRDRRDRPRLSLRFLAARRAARRVSRANPAGARARPADRDSHARSRRRHAAHPSRGRAGPAARRVPLLYRRSRPRPIARWRPDSSCRFPASRPFPRPKRCARRPPRRRRTACWSKPTARTWRRFRIAASATSRRTSRRSSSSSPRSAARPPRQIGEQTDRNFDAPVPAVTAPQSFVLQSINALRSR